MTNLRIGHGYDVHRLAEGRDFILGGVKIPHEKGLLGHSDADVLLHALMDALLGAAAMGDIGQMFPDTSAEFKDISSIELLKRVYNRIVSEGYQIVNVDTTVLAQAPKLAPHMRSMRANIAAALCVAIDAISIKATTEEGLGFTGEKLGVAAHAVVLIEKVR